MGTCYRNWFLPPFFFAVNWLGANGFIPFFFFFFFFLLEEKRTVSICKRVFADCHKDVFLWMRPLDVLCPTFDKIWKIFGDFDCYLFHFYCIFHFDQMKMRREIYHANGCAFIEIHWIPNNPLLVPKQIKICVFSWERRKKNCYLAW